MVSVFLVSLGIVLCFLGLLGIFVVIYVSLKIKKNNAKNSNNGAKLTFKELIVLNYVSLSLSAFGLIIVVLGLFFK